MHLGFLILISLVSTQAVRRLPELVLTTPPDTDPLVEEITQHEFHFGQDPPELIGSTAIGGPEEGLLPREVETPDIPQLEELEIQPQEVGQIELRAVTHAATGPEVNLNHTIKGMAGAGVTGAQGAIDRITQEILMSLEERRTLVVWLFDRSGSLSSQRDEINRRFQRVYDELGAIESSGNEAFANSDSKPLLTSVVTFGHDIEFPISKPTDDLEQIRNAVAEIELDDSGIERVFAAIQMAVGRYRKYRDRPSTDATGPGRNVMFVVFTDEAGDDQDQLDKTVNLCRRLAIPVYIVGVPAPFGRKETLVKWVDPDPSYDQSPQWGRVDQGPESLLPERVKIHFARTRFDNAPIDSGFGPFALTRLCYETGGIYFTVHPNRTVTKYVSRRETAPYAAHIRAFFDEQTMRRYRPDYVSAKEYMRRVKSSGSRNALIEAAQMSWLAPMKRPRVRFIYREEARFSAELTAAQKAAAKLEPMVRVVYETLRRGEAARKDETVPRWQAGYDLAMGRVLAVKVRTETYNVMLARAKQGMKFSDPRNNTWELVPSTEILSGSTLKNQANQALTYLGRIQTEHEKTPWALLAQRELKEPLGWTWKESFTDLNPPRRQQARNNNNRPRAASDEKARKIKRRPPRRRPPKL